MAVHRSYLNELWPLLEDGLIHGMAHITGGGLPDNLPRVLPETVGVKIDTSAMPRVPVFDFLVEAGAVRREESYRVFNMGFGMIMMVGAADVASVQDRLKQAGEPSYVVGEVVAGNREVMF